MDQNSNPPGAEPSSPGDLPNPGPADTPVATHHLENVKVGNHSVQLLVSTHLQVYDASEVEAGEDSWQVIGAWEPSTASELTQILSQRSTTRAAAPSSDKQPRFGASYGAGKTLGMNAKQNPDAAK